ncbi:MAG: RnfABCDGE type electron transport complex subunit G [Gallionellaceae bacterium]|nr:RnfABCDGE type electron transport complex subunit G [Gallionellaceae bacterium]
MAMLERLRGHLAYQGALLAVAALLTSGALALAAKATGPAIEAAAAEDLKQSLTQVLPGQYDNDLLDDKVVLPGPDGEVTVYRARQAGRVVAVVFEVAGRGYAGPVVSMLGVDRDGRILGVRVIAHRETPGLGDKIEPAKDRWIHAFAGKSLGAPPADRFAVKKDGGVFDQFAGATITPRAVVNSVKGGLAFFGREKARLLDEEVKS